MIKHKRILQKPPTPAQNISSLIPQIGKFSPILESVNNQTENILTEPNISEHNNPTVVMATPHPQNLRVKKLSEVIITDNNAQPKLKTQTGFAINSVVLCPSLYLYHGGLRRDDLME